MFLIGQIFMYMYAAAPRQDQRRVTMHELEALNFSKELYLSLAYIEY